MIERVARWAEARDDIRAAVLVGSRARADHPADEFSDIDLILFARDATAFVGDPSWVAELGDVGITFVEQTPIPGVRERRVLYADGTDVDFVVVDTEHVSAVVAGASVVWSRGMRVLVDKDGLIEPLTGMSPHTPAGPPSEHDYRETVSDFWYHALWTARKLARGEVFTAKSCCDSHMKHLLLRMLEWDAGDCDTWHDGRFLEEWADPRVVEGLGGAYARYDAADVARALDATMDLFAWLATETGERLGYGYAAGEEALARRLISASR